MLIRRGLSFFLLLVLAGFAVAAGNQSLKEEWARVLIAKDVRPSDALPAAKWNDILKKGVAYSEKSGVHPRVDMPVDEWRNLLSAAGVDVSLIPGLATAASPAVSPPSSSSKEDEQQKATTPPLPTPPPTPVRPPDLRVVETVPSEAPAAPQAEPVAQRAATVDVTPKTKPISLDLRDMDIVDVLKILSRQSGVNIVVGKGVSGKVTVFLDKVDLWEALQTILETRDLAYMKEKNLVRVITAQDYEKSYGVPFGRNTETKVLKPQYVKARTAKEFLEPFKSKVGTLIVNEAANTLVARDTPEQIELLENILLGLDVPVETRVFKLNYGSVEDILPKVTPLVSKEFGNIQSDKRTNSMVVTDNPVRLKEIADIVKAFDVKNKAVLIEAKMVQVLLKDEYQWGINWERAFHYNRDADSSYSGVAVGNTQLLPLETVNPLSGAKIAAPGITANIMSLSGLQITGAINFLETFGKTRILSSPRITALNNQEAKILVGTKEAFITRTVINAGSTTQSPVVTEQVSFVDVGVKLFVTPVIGDDGYITMKIKPEVSSVESTVNTTNGSSIPIVRLSEAETSLVVKDGVTVVIGGLIEERKGKSSQGVPILSRIPILGLPFRGSSRLNNKTELVIFLTPHITTGDVVSAETEVYLNPKELEEPKGKKKKKKRETEEWKG